MTQQETPDPLEKTWCVLVRSKDGVESCVARDQYGLIVAASDDDADRMTQADANALVVTLRTFVPQSFGSTFWYRFQPR